MQRLPGLDLLRAIAILSVLFTHAWVAGGVGYGFAWLENYGWMGVDLFFVLSGYLIGRQVLAKSHRGESLDLKGFYRQRAYRILPAYAVVLALYVFVPVFRGAQPLQPIWQYLTFTVNLFIEPGIQHAFSSVWSLCVEEHFYLVFPLAILLVAPVATVRRVATLMLAVVVAGMLWRAHAWHAWPGAAPKPGELQDMEVWHYMQLIYYPTYARLDGLLGGVALAMLSVYRPAVWQHVQAKPHALSLAGLLLLWLSAWIFDDTMTFNATVYGYPLLSVALVLLVASATSARSVWAKLRLPGVSWIAAASYSLYLVHKAIFQLVFTHLPESLAHLGTPTFFFSALCAVAAAALLHHGVERPFLRLRDRHRARGAADAPAAVT